MVAVDPFSRKELIDSYHDGLKEAVDFINKVVIPPLKGQISLTSKEEAILGTFYRIHGLASSLIRLNHLLDFNAVAIIARTIYELLLDIKFLSSPQISQLDLDRFTSFPQIDRYKKARRLVELQKTNTRLAAHTLLNSAKRKSFVMKRGMKLKIENQVCRLWGHNKRSKPNWPDHWSGTSIRERAKAFGPLYEQEYLEIYSLLSAYVHSGSSAYSGFTGGNLEIIYGAALEYSRKMYIESLLICAKIFHLWQAVESFHPVVCFLQTAPHEILIEYGLKQKVKQ
jgi:hypothetical protein